MIVDNGATLDMNGCDNEVNTLSGSGTVENSAAGDYPLIGYGSLTGSLSDLVLPAPPPYTGYSLSTTVDPGYIDLVVVPEPSTFALLGVGAVALLGYAWRRQRKALPPPSCPSLVGRRDR